MIAKTLIFAFLLTVGGVFADNTCKKWLTPTDALDSLHNSATEKRLKDIFVKSNVLLNNTVNEICKNEIKTITDFTSVLNITTSCLGKEDNFQDIVKRAVEELCKDHAKAIYSCAQPIDFAYCFNVILFEDDKTVCTDFDKYTNCFVNIMKSECSEASEKLKTFVDSFKKGLKCKSEPPKDTSKTSKTSKNETVAATTNSTTTTEKPKSAASVTTTVPLLLTMAAVILQVVVYK